CPTGEGWSITSEAEQGERPVPGGLEAERETGEQADLGVGRLDQPVGQAVLDRGEYPGTVFETRARVGGSPTPPAPGASLTTDTEGGHHCRVDCCPRHCRP